MADLVPPFPVDAPFGSYNAVDWFQKIRRAINAAGDIHWSSITDFTGSNLNQLVTRDHASLQNILGNGSGHIPAGGTTGQTLTKINATDYNTQWSRMSGPAFSAYPSSNQTGIVAGSFTKVVLGTEEFDTDNYFASSTFTPQVAGYYQINSSVYVSTGGTQMRGIIYKNGSAYKTGSYFAAIGGTSGISTGSCIVFLNGSTDFIELYVNPQALATVDATSSLTYLNGCWIRA